MAGSHGRGPSYLASSTTDRRVSFPGPTCREPSSPTAPFNCHSCHTWGGNSGAANIPSGPHQRALPHPRIALQDTGLLQRTSELTDQAGLASPQPPEHAFVSEEMNHPPTPIPFPEETKEQRPPTADSSTGQQS